MLSVCPVAPSKAVIARNGRAQLLSPAKVQPRRLHRTIQTQALFKGATKTSTPYICIDCGYIYNGQQGKFQDLPNSYRCPTCQAPKRRFKVYSPSQKGGGSKASSSNAQGAGDGDSASYYLKLAAAGVVLLGVLYAAATALT